MVSARRTDEECMTINELLKIRRQLERKCDDESKILNVLVR